MIQSRIVLHFPGFEPLDAEAHRQRYKRSAAQASAVWQAQFKVDDLLHDAQGAHFSVDAYGEGWATRSQIHVFDHNDLIAAMRAEPLWMQIAKGFKAGFDVVRQGGAWRYFRNAWRFGLFFLFPFLFVAAGLALAVNIAAIPSTFELSSLWFLLALPAGYLVFRHGVIPFSDRYHVLHLLADWRLAVAVAENRREVDAFIERAAGEVGSALEGSADEILVTSHSMGANFAISVVGRLLETSPDALKGRRLVFVTLGGAALQCSLLSSASLLRQRIGALARHPSVDWFDIQCLTDPIHLYKCHTVALSGHADAPQPKLVFVRFKHALSAERYQKNRRDFLRMHRQYVLGPDQPSGFDFTLMTAGPLPARSFEALESATAPKLQATQR
ncbi:hypothetical protein SAMN05880561_106158 [Rhizobium sp. RU33A]|uniref:hypothetical protein n=1 Tax=Rhizobium sp. RU33A TaxID=1907413 RepID=UPI000953BD07|nr:hypothetical protein [Rhizobium sp. RU33A]SIQ95455.1 hypothetical protein SAMN05880561_106158 [Rhizobium sp. RU33A]